MNPTIPEAAVQAALCAWLHEEEYAYILEKWLEDEDRQEDMRKVLTVALPFLQGVKVKALEWVDHQHGSRCVTDRVYDISIWMEGGKPLYVDSYTTMRRFRLMNEAKAAAQADYEARILSAIEPAPSPRAQALEEAHSDLLNRLNDDIAQLNRMAKQTKFAGSETGVRVKSPSVLLADLRDAAAAIRALSSQPVAGGPERGKFYHKHWELSKLLEARNGGLVDHSGGEVWRYEYTSKDENGKYDMLYRRNVNASVPARLPASPGASE